MKYKLINIETKETHLCNKVSLDGFDYYVSDEFPNVKDFCIDIYSNLLVRCTKESYGSNSYDFFRKVIATNNPNIDCPKVVDEVEKLAKEHCEYWEFNRLLGSGSNGLAHDSFVFGYNKSQETHPNSDEDMIEFAEWLDNNKQQREYHPMSCMSHKELIQLFKKQQPKTIYFN